MKNVLVVVSALLLVLMWSCHKIDANDTPVPVWEDQGPDSVSLNATIQTVTGYRIPGQYVNVALSPDSLSKGVLVRRTQTDGNGTAKNRRLYPLRYFINCYAIYQGKNYFGSYVIATKPAQRLDTVLLVY